MSVPTKESIRTHIRWMIRKDMPEVLSIEAASFPENQTWGEKEFLDTLRDRHNIGMVVEDCTGRHPHQDNPVVGYVIYGLSKHSLSIINFAIKPERRRLGVGSRVMRKLIGKLSYRRDSIEWMVREHNLPVQLFLRSLGFRAEKSVRNLYADEDGILMTYRLARPCNDEEGDYPEYLENDL